MLGSILKAIAAVVALSTASAVRSSEPCTAATDSCSEWLAPTGTKERLLVFRTFPLDAPNEKIATALVVVHGYSRDADNYFRTVTVAAFLAGALQRTLIIAPRFAANDGKRCKDALAADEFNWACPRENNWRSGGTAVNNDAITSFDLADEIVGRLARDGIFPNLKLIVVAGHSAGGQFVTRYAMANQIHERSRVPLAYVVANPSSYVYLDNYRPSGNGADDLRPFPGAAACPQYNRWPYGLERRSGYAARVEDEQLKKQFAARAVTYLLGDLDTLPAANFDVSCAGMAQGPNRFARGNAYLKYAVERFHAPHRALMIPLCGHNARCMFNADRALPVLFPTP